MAAPPAAAPVAAPAAALRRGRWRFDLLGYLIILASVAIPVTVVLLGQRAETAPPTEAWNSDVDAAGRIRPLADVARVTRQAKLITMTVDSTVRATVRDDSWRGDATATVEAPVRYSFGVDLAGLKDDAVRFDYLRREYVVSVPAPTCLAVEVDGAHPTRQEIHVTGTRFKSMAGRDQLVLAQRAIHDVARQQALPQPQREQVRAATREQVASLVGAFVGPRYGVRVRFLDE